MNADEMMTSTGRVSRTWLVVRRWFDLLPRWYWLYAIGCVLFFSAAWPTSISDERDISIDRVFFGIPRSPHVTEWVLRSNFDTTGRPSGGVIGLAADILATNLVFWLLVFSVPLIIALIGTRTVAGWSQTNAIAARYFAIVCLIVLINKPINYVCYSWAAEVFPSVAKAARINDLDRFVIVSSMMQTGVFIVLVTVLALGIRTRVMQHWPLIGRWIMVIAIAQLVWGVCELMQSYWFLRRYQSVAIGTAYEMTRHPFNALSPYVIVPMLVNLKLRMSLCLMLLFVVDLLLVFVHRRFSRTRLDTSLQ